QPLRFTLFPYTTLFRSEKYFLKNLCAVKSPTLSAYQFVETQTSVRWGRLRMPKRPQFGFKGGSASAEKRLMHKQMLDDWDAIRAALPEVDAQFIKDTREKLRCSRALFARRLWM